MADRFAHGRVCAICYAVWSAKCALRLHLATFGSLVLGVRCIHTRELGQGFDSFRIDISRDKHLILLEVLPVVSLPRDSLDLIHWDTDIFLFSLLMMCHFGSTLVECETVTSEDTSKVAVEEQKTYYHPIIEL